MTGILIGEATKLKLSDTYEAGTHLILVMNPVDYTEEWEYGGETGRGVGTSVAMSSDPDEAPKDFLEKANDIMAGEIAFAYTVGQECNIAYSISNGFNRGCKKGGCPGAARCKL